MLTLKLLKMAVGIPKEPSVATHDWGQETPAGSPGVLPTQGLPIGAGTTG